MKNFYVKKRRDPNIEKVGFTKNNMFFFESGRVCTIWNYKDEDRIIVYEEKDSIYDLVWLNQNQYILFRKYKQAGPVLFGYDIEVKWNEILSDKSIKEKSKRKIVSDMVGKMNEVGHGNMLIKNIDGEYICTVVGGKCKMEFLIIKVI